MQFAAQAQSLPRALPRHQLRRHPSRRPAGRAALRRPLDRRDPHRRHRPAARFCNRGIGTTLLASAPGRSAGRAASRCASTSSASILRCGSTSGSGSGRSRIEACICSWSGRADVRGSRLAARGSRLAARKSLLISVARLRSKGQSERPRRTPSAVGSASVASSVSDRLARSSTPAPRSAITRRIGDILWPPAP